MKLYELSDHHQRKKRQAIDNLIGEAASKENQRAIQLATSIGTENHKTNGLSTEMTKNMTILTEKKSEQSSALIQLRTGSIVKVKVLPGPFIKSTNNKCRKCKRILSSRVSMKVHLMETHHEVYQNDHEWLDLLVDDDQNKLHFQVIGCFSIFFLETFEE